MNSDQQLRAIITAILYVGESITVRGVITTPGERLQQANNVADLILDELDDRDDARKGYGR